VTIKSNTSTPSFPVLAYTGVAAFIIGMSFLILELRFTVWRLAQICQSIVTTNAVDVVDLASRPSLVRESPDNAMG
jgi:hypothetical protein